MVYSFSKIVKDILKELPKNDYPVLNTRLFVSCWLSFSLDKSLSSMRDLFRRLKFGSLNLDISTFSKASKKREVSGPPPFNEGAVAVPDSPVKVFKDIYEQLRRKIKNNFNREKYQFCPIDSTLISLTSQRDKA